MLVTRMALHRGAQSIEWPKGQRLMGVTDETRVIDVSFGRDEERPARVIHNAALIVLVPERPGPDTTRYFNVVEFDQGFPEHPNDNRDRTWQYIGTSPGGLAVFEDVAVPDPLHHLWTSGPAGNIYHGAVAAPSIEDACVALAERDDRFGAVYNPEDRTWKGLKVCASSKAAVNWRRFQEGADGE